MVLNETKRWCDFRSHLLRTSSPSSPSSPLSPGPKQQMLYSGYLFKDCKLKTTRHSLNFWMDQQHRIQRQGRGWAKKHEIYVAAFGGHLFYDLFVQGWGGGGWYSRNETKRLTDFLLFFLLSLTGRTQKM